MMSCVHAMAVSKWLHALWVCHIQCGNLSMELIRI